MHFENWAWFMRWTLQLILLWLNLLNVFECFSVWMSAQMLYCLSICLPCFQNMLTCFIVVVYYHQYLTLFFLNWPNIMKPPQCNRQVHFDNWTWSMRWTLQLIFLWLKLLNAFLCGCLSKCSNACQNTLAYIIAAVYYYQYLLFKKTHQT